MSDRDEPAEASILTEPYAGWRRIVLNRPAKLNAFDDGMHVALREALDEAAGDPSVRAVVLTGAGKGFCAGQDLSARLAKEGDAPPDLSNSIAKNWNPLVRRIRSMPCPVIAAVNGVAAGAGANIALACDIVIASDTAKFIQAFSKIGLIPDAGGTHTLPRLVGAGRAFALAALAEPVSAAEAARIGMIWKAVAAEALAETAAATAERLAALPTDALVALREALSHSQSATFEEQIAFEAEMQGRLGRSADYREGVRSFFEKRPPQWQARSRG